MRTGLLLLVALIGYGAYLLNQDSPEHQTKDELPLHHPALVVEQNRTLLTVDAAMQASSGIEAMLPTATSLTTGRVLYGTVLDLQALVDLSARRVAGAAERDAAGVAAAVAGAALDRAQALYRDAETASLKELQTAQAANSAATAKLKAMQANFAAIESAARQQYGPVVSAWASSPSASALAPFLARRDVLLRIVMDQAEEAPALLKVTGDGAPSMDAHLISPSPQVDPGLPGQPYFYRATAPWATGTRISARAPIPLQGKNGLLIPASAIVWYGGQPWAYVQTDSTHFSRRPVNPDASQDGDYVVTHGFSLDERIVIRGAQLLLSEESRTPAGGPQDDD